MLLEFEGPYSKGFWIHVRLYIDSPGVIFAKWRCLATKIGLCPDLSADSTHTVHMMGH